jgi:phosphoribosylformimino-5-aminoimidazole carboxamide ribotide isomerase
MRIYPAIDIKAGRCVRLVQGRADQETVYHTDPLAPARQFLEDGAEWVHVVDLDGAFSGNPINLELIRGICALGMKVQTGGGLRSLQQVEAALAAGVTRVVIGTRACQEPNFVNELVKAFGEHIAVGIDANNGKVSIHGWTEDTDLQVLDFARTLEDMGVCTLIHTDIATDGMMKGPNLRAQQALLQHVKTNVIASGGVSRPEDIQNLAALAKQFPNLDGVIVGKALYEGTVSLRDMLGVA